MIVFSKLLGAAYQRNGIDDLIPVLGVLCVYRSILQITDNRFNVYNGSFELCFRAYGHRRERNLQGRNTFY